MNAKKIINIFENYALESNYSVLPEGPIVREKSAETFFNMSPISNNIEVFDNGMNTGKTKKIYCKQASFYSNKFDGVGTNPLTNPLEIGLGFFSINECNPVKFIESFFSVFRKLGLEKKNMFFRIDNESFFLDWLTENDINEKNVYVWRKLEKFHIGSQRPKGYYLYPYYKHLNGVVPLGSIAYFENQDKFFFDSVFFVERLELISQSCYRMISIESFRFFLNEQLPDSLINRARYILFIRILAFLVKDGLYEVDRKGQGFYFKKVSREIAFLLNGYQMSRTEINFFCEQFNRHILEYNYCIEDIGLFKERFAKAFEYINQSSLAIKKTLDEQLPKIEPIDIASQLTKLKNSLGIQPEWVKLSRPQFSNLMNVEIPIKQRTSIRSKCLGTTKNEIVNISSLLEEPL